MRPDPGLSDRGDRSFYGVALDARKHVLAGFASTGYVLVLSKGAVEFAFVVLLGGIATGG